MSSIVPSFWIFKPVDDFIENVRRNIYLAMSTCGLIDEPRWLRISEETAV